MSQKGFTLAEVMIAVFVTLIGVVAVYNLVPRIVRDVAYNNDRFIATQLAAEGVEIVRNIRDGNWLEQRTDGGVNWNTGLGDGVYEVDYNDGGLSSYSGQALKIDINGFYNRTDGIDTQFKRKITITNGADEILVAAQVLWQDKSVSVVEKFYNWR